MSFNITISCKQHPKYKAVLKPTDCPHCWSMYYLRSAVELLLDPEVVSFPVDYVSIRNPLIKGIK